MKRQAKVGTAFKALLLMCVAAAAVSCESQDDKASKSFKEIAAKLVSELQRSYGEPLMLKEEIAPGESLASEQKVSISDKYSIDVRKTDSVLSPFTAVLSIPV